MNVKIKGLIHLKLETGEYTSFSSDMSDYGYVVVGPAEFDYEIPADFDAVALKITSLNKKLSELESSHFVLANRIKSQIRDLICIENNHNDDAVA